MKPLTPRDYLFPVGNECLVPSMLEAFVIFSQENLYGTIQFGVAHCDDGDTLCWLLTPSHGLNQPLKAFDDDITGAVQRFTPVSKNTYFTWQGRFFKLVAERNLQLVIKEVSCLATEADVYGYACSLCNTEEVEIHPVKVYLIGQKREYLFAAWFAQTSEETDTPSRLIPMFMQDMQLGNAFCFNDLNWEFMNIGEMFEHDGELWRVYQNGKDGLFINKAFNAKCIKAFSQRKQN